MQRCRLSDRDDIDVLGVIGPLDSAQWHRVLSATNALYGREDRERGGLPAFTPASLGRLCAFAQASALAGLEAAQESLNSPAERVGTAEN